MRTLPLTSARPAVKVGAWWVVGVALLTLMLIVSVGVGSVAISPARILDVLSGGGTPLEQTIVLKLRLPRALLAALVGGCLALSGGVLQAALRNPLGDPHIVGVSAGAGLGAVIAFAFFPTNFALLPVAAFTGAILAAGVVYLLAYGGGASPLKLVLAGVALTSLLGAATNAILSLTSAPLQTVMAWLMGGLSGRSWSDLALFAPWALVGIVGTLLAARVMNVLSLGDEAASGVGLRVGVVRFVLIALGAVLAGGSVASAGLIGFVGLMVPHVARLLVGADHARMLPLAFLLGATLLCGADLAARTLLDPAELPVGVFTAALGAPYFLHLLRRRA